MAKSLLHIAEKHGVPHKVLLQLIMKIGSVRLSQIIQVFHEICDACFISTSIPEVCTIDTLSKALMNSINPILARMELKLAISTDYRFPDERFLTMYSNASVGKFTKVLTDDELQMFQQWFKMMFFEEGHGHRGELDGLEAINIKFNNGRRRPINAEALLKKLVDDNIFVKLKNHNSYVFTAKSLMELDPRLRYNIPQCLVCSQLITLERFSFTCGKCKNAMHNSCLYRMITLSKNAVACPGRCNTKFNKDTLEEFEFDADLPEKIKATRVIKGNDSKADDDDEEESGDENAEEEGSQAEDEDDNEEGVMASQDQEEDEKENEGEEDVASEEAEDEEEESEEE